VSTGGGGPSSIIYRLGFEAADPEKAAEVANALAALLLKATLEQRTDQARSVTRFLRQALEEDERELRAHSHLMSEFRRTYRGQLPSDLETNLRKLDLREERREDLSSEIARAQARLEGGSANPAARFQTENEMLLDELRRQLAGELAAHTEDHPNVVSLRRQVANFEAAVAKEQTGETPASPAREAQRREIELMRHKLGKIDAEIDQLSEQVDQIPIVAEKLAALEQKETVLREDYLNSLRKVEDAELAETLEVAQHGAHIEILERARPPGSPNQSRWLVLAVGLAASVVLGMAVGALFELLDPVLLVASQMEDVVERPVLGSLPRVST
jgi:succinoglycan biosynthesis transport protein ExoP